MPDPRLTPARPDLAAAHLRGTVRAERFVDGRAAAIIAPSAALLRRPDPDAPWETQALYGEAATVYDERDGFAWVQLARDGYVGYLKVDALGDAVAPTHRVAALRTHAYPGASIKLPHRFALSLGALIAITAADGDFLVDGKGRRYWARHLAPVDSVEPDFVAVAEKFLHAPYLWGGRTSQGIDCSGLTQAGLTAAGVAAPRDSDMLERLGAPADAPLKRGDLVYWSGHVGVLRDAETLLHANGYHMAVASEPLAGARARIAASGGGEITSIRRLAI
ncbi:MAG: C40 family peptidase [Pseudomonadota bacterium]|nr:C40 family peptidase [Pseudomonadota bacterium]